MSNGSGEQIILARECRATEIPSGIPHTLAAGSRVRLLQALGGSFTVMDDLGYMLRIDAEDAEALGKAKPLPVAQNPAEFSEKLVWDELRTVYDPEIPVNVVDLGLIYSCQITREQDAHKIEIKMSMTAPGCGMGDILKGDIQRKLSNLPAVGEVQVEVVFDPPWNPAMMSEAARLQLGFDLDSGTHQSYGSY